MISYERSNKRSALSSFLFWFFDFLSSSYVFFALNFFLHQKNDVTSRLLFLRVDYFLSMIADYLRFQIIFIMIGKKKFEGGELHTEPSGKKPLTKVIINLLNLSNVSF